MTDAKHESKAGPAGTAGTASDAIHDDTGAAPTGVKSPFEPEFTEALCEIFPDADLFTLFHVRGSVSAAIEGHRIHTSWLARLPFASRHYRRLLPLFPSAIERFDLRRYDFIVSSSHCVAKAVVPAGQARHLCYCHSPMRYAWDQFEAYFGADRVGPAASRDR